MKLSKIQQKTLNKMKLGKWYTAYDLKVSISTLYALLKKDFIVGKNFNQFGAKFFSRVVIEFKKIKD